LEGMGLIFRIIEFLKDEEIQAEQASFMELLPGGKTMIDLHG
jgi:hypothetical protein